MEPDAIAPDGSEVRLLGGLCGSTMASFTLPAGACSEPIKHRTVEELWIVISGAGQMWRKQSDREEVVDPEPSMGLSIPLDTRFQFRAASDRPFVAVGVTMPP